MQHLFRPFFPKPERGFNVQYAFERRHGMMAETVRDILTDASERLGYMENTFRYSISPDGNDLLADTGTPLTPMLRQGIASAEAELLYDSRWQIEVTRRNIEIKQHESAVLFAREHGTVQTTSFSLDGRNDQEGLFGEEPLRNVIAELAPYLEQQMLETPGGLLDPTKLLDYCFEKDGALWFISMPPDCVRDTGEGIGGGYDPKRLKTVVRIVSPIAHDAAKLAGHIRQVYDSVLTEQYGGEWHGGRRPEGLLGESNIMEFIMRQPQLINAHLARVRQALGGDLGMGDYGTMVYDDLQYNFVAALHSLLQNKTIKSLEAAGALARKEGLKFDGDCPTSPLRIAEAQLESLGLLRPKKMHCPFCRSANVKVENSLDPTCSNKSCRDCGSTVLHGQVTRRFRNRRNVALAA